MQRVRQRELGAALAVALCLAGCGSGAGRHTAPPPRLPRALAAALAARSDAVAQALDAGDSCGALSLAQDLQRQTIAAINAGRVSGPLQEPLQGAANLLVGRIRCTPAAPAPGKYGDHPGKSKGREKHEKGND